MSAQDDQSEQPVRETQLRDFARARFYNYTIHQLVPRYIELRDAERRSLPPDTQNALAASLRACTATASAYAALGQVPDPNAILAALLKHMLEQSRQGKSSTTYLPKHQEHIEALLNDITKGTIALASDLDTRELDSQRVLLIEDIRTMEFLSNLMD
jgi:hypothetical protein